MSLVCRIEHLQRKLTLRQRLLFDYLCYRHERECCVTLDALCVLFGVDETSVVQCVREDLRALQKASMWLATEGGEQLVGLIDKAAVNVEARMVLVQMGEVLDYIA